MTEQLSREVLQKVVDAADAVISALKGENEDVHKDDSTKMCRLWDELNDKYAPPEIVRGIARMLLAGMHCEPGEYLTHVIDDGFGAFSDRMNFSLPVGTKLYAAPPAPVAVPDDGREQFEAWVKFHLDDEHSIVTLHRTNGGLNYRDPHVDLAWIAWKESRAAMLKAGPVTATTVPDGWKLVPVEPTKEMIDAGWSYYMTTKSPSSLGVYGAMLAAAPEQEV